MKYLLFMLIFISSVFANIGKVSAVVGNANIERNNKTLGIKVGAVIEKNDIVRTQANAKVQLIFTDNTIITVGKNSALNINDYLYDANNPQNSKANFNFFKGAFKTITGQIGKINKKKFKLKTSSASIGIRGTIVLGTQDVIACTSGGITVESGGQTINVNANELTTVAQGQAPTPAQKITAAKLKELEAALGGAVQSSSGGDSEEPSAESSDTDAPEELQDNKGNPNKGLTKIIDILEKINQYVTEIKVEEANVDQSALTVIDTIDDIQSTLYELDMAKDNAEDAKTDAAAASYDSHTEYDKAVTNNSSYTDVEVAYAAYAAETSVKSADDNAAIAAEQAAIAENIYNDLEANLGTKIATIDTELSKATTARDNAQLAYNNALTEKNKLLTILNTLDAGTDADVRDTAQQGLLIAEDKLDEAAASLSDAEDKLQAAIDEYGEVGPFDEDSILTDALTTKNAAQTAKTQAQIEADNVISDTKLTAAIDAAKTASSNVKTVMTAQTLKSLTTDGSNVDVNAKTFVLSGVRKETPLKQTIGDYSFHSHLGVFKDTYEDEEVLYNVQADNLHEFFVGYTKGATDNKALFVYGEDFTGTLDDTKVYMYQNFKTFDKTFSTKGQLKTEDMYYYYNAKRKSMTAVSKDFFSQGAKQFVVGYDKTVQTIENGFEINGGTLSDVSSQTKVRDVDFKGGLAQGLVQTLTTDGEVVEMNTSFLQEEQAKDESIVGRTLEGKTEFLVYNPATNSVEMRTEDIDIDITGSTTLNIDASIKNSSDTTLVNFDSDVSSDLEAYYINSDIFGVKNNDGFLMAVPDGAIVGDEFVMFDDTDNPLTTADDASWGYWTGKELFTDLSTNISDGSVGHQSVWVAGVKTAQGVVQAMMDDTTQQTLEFKGKVLGHVNTETILGDDTNKVDITFQVGVGANTMSGTMQFKSANSHHFKLDMNFDTVTSSGFSGDFKSQGSVNQVDNSFNEFSGNYYGDTTIKSVGGNFKVKEQGDTATGVFKALKK